MRKFAFICHPLDFQHMASVDTGVLKKSPRLVRQVMAQLPPNRVRTIEIQSPSGDCVQGELISVWLLPDQFKNLDSRLVITKITQALQIAADLGCELAGLGAYTKIAAIGMPKIYDQFPFAITTGNTYTAALSAQALERIIQQKNWIRDQVEFTVVGATGSIGNAVLRTLAPQVAKVNLVGRNQKSLDYLAHQVKNYGPKVQTFQDAKFACREANLIFLATSEPGLLIQATDLTHNACVVDISKPVNILPDRNRPDVTIIDCAMVRTPPRKTVRNWVQCFPHVEGLDSPEVYACFAEAIILALEGRMESYSRGRHLELSKFNEILTLAQRHGLGSELEIGPWTVKSTVESNAELPEISKISMSKFGMAS